MFRKYVTLINGAQDSNIYEKTMSGPWTVFQPIIYRSPIENKVNQTYRINEMNLSTDGRKAKY